MDKYAAFFLTLAAIGGVGILVADEPAGGCCDCGCIGQIVDYYSTNTSVCASNCVHMTPETCESVKAEITNGAYYVQHMATQQIDIYIPQAILQIDIAVSQLDDIGNYLDTAKLHLSDLPSVSIESLNLAISKLISFSNAWSDVDGSQGLLFVSNRATSATQVITPGRKVNVVLRSVLPSLQSLRDDLANNVDDVTNRVDAAKASIDLSLSQLTSTKYYLSDPTFGARAVIEGTKSNLEDIRAMATSIVADADRLDCSPCGRGSSSGDGTGGGSCSTLDLTPLLQSVQNLQADLQYRLDRMYYLLKPFFDDWYYARSNPAYSSAPSLTDYGSMGDNWFQRIEYLLYSAAYSNLSSTDDGGVPDSPDNATAIDDARSSGDSLADEEKDNFSSTLSTNFERFYRSADAFFHRMVSFAPTSAGSLDGVVILSNGKADANGGWSLRIDSSAESESHYLGSALAKVRLAFRILWSLLALALYLYTLVFFCKFVAKAVVFVLKIGSSNAG